MKLASQTSSRIRPIRPILFSGCEMENNRAASAASCTFSTHPHKIEQREILGFDDKTF